MPPLRLFRVDARPYGRDLAALAAGISAAEADLVCVHGAPSLLRWRSKSGAVARRSGLVVVGGGRTGGGNLLLSDLGVDVEGTQDLVFGGGRGARPSGATLARLAVAGSRFTLAGVRLSGAAADQARQLTELDEALTHLAPALAPLVVCVQDAGPGAAVTLNHGRTVPAAGVFVDAAIAASPADGGVVELTLP